MRWASVFLLSVACQLVDVLSNKCDRKQCERREEKRPNILLYLMDDLGWSDVHYNGAEFTTPTIDRLSKAGVRFDQYYVQPVCSPARAALLSGRYPFRDGLAHTVVTNGFPIGLSPKLRTLADELRSAGYATHMAGKWDVGMASWKNTPTYRGFDSFLGFYNAFEGHYTHETVSLPGIAATPVIADSKGLDLRNGTAPLWGCNGTYSVDLYTRQLKQIIERHNFGESPLFLYAAMSVVHEPLEAPLRFLRRCAGVGPAKRRMLCAMAKAADDSLAQLERSLKKRGQWSDTLLLFMTDNGGQTSQGSSNWPLRAGKLTVYEGGVRGLAFAHGAMLRKRGYVNHGLIHTVDWLPTLVEGVARRTLQAREGHDKLDGLNLWEMVSEGVASDRKEIVLQIDPPFHNRSAPYQHDWLGQAAYRLGEWKLIVGEALCAPQPVARIHRERCDDGWIRPNSTKVPPPPAVSAVQLFNIERDPREMHNLAKEFPEVVRLLWNRMKTRFIAHVPKQFLPLYDPRSNPANFGGVWTPWLDLNDGVGACHERV